MTNPEGFEKYELDSKAISCSPGKIVSILWSSRHVAESKLSPTYCQH